jgi:hypothetical protein
VATLVQRLLELIGESRRIPVVMLEPVRPVS